MSRRAVYLALAIVAVLAIAAASLDRFVDRLRWAHAERGCASNLRQIGFAISMYADANGGVLPDSFATLALHFGADLPPIVFVCPLTDDVGAPGPTTLAVARQLTQGGHLSHIYTGRGLAMAAVTADTVLAFEPASNHGDGMHVLLGDLHVEKVDLGRAREVAARAAAGTFPVLLPPPSTSASAGAK